MAPETFFTVLDKGPHGLTVRTEQHAVGPWDASALHAGPPIALAVSHLDDEFDQGMRMSTRVSAEILRPVPTGVLQVRGQVLRPGRKVELLRADVSPEGGEPVLTVAIWRIRVEDKALGVGVEGATLPAPDTAAPAATKLRPVSHTGYTESMEVRFLEGEWATPGPGTAWMRQRHPLRDDRPTSPLERVLVVADSGNGISARSGSDVLPAESIFVNVDLGVHLTRYPEGEWIGMQAQTVLTDHGIGLATTVLHDILGPIGRGAQSLLVEPEQR